MKKLEEVIEGCRRGDRLAQKELYDRYSSRFNAFCRRYAADDETAKDILIEGFLDVFQCVGKYRGDGSFEGWMQTIFLRKAISFYRRNARRMQDTVSIDNRDFDMASSVDVYMQIDVRDALIEAIRELSDEERVVFNLVAVEGSSLNEAAKEIGIPESTVKTRYYRALRIVRSLIEKRLGKDNLYRNK